VKVLLLTKDLKRKLRAEKRMQPAHGLRRRFTSEEE
jgi:hypothetical protein